MLLGYGWFNQPIGCFTVDRKEAIALIRKLIELDLAQPSFVSIEKNSQGTFNLTMKLNNNINEIKAFVAEKDLIIYEDRERGTCTIRKP